MTERPGSRLALRILLIDPHEQVRESLARRLLMDERVSGVLAAATADAASGLVLQDPPDVALIDPLTPSTDWREGVRELARVRAGTTWFPIVIHVARDGDVDAAEVRSLGADLYVLKGLRTERLLSLLADARVPACGGSSAS